MKQWILNNLMTKAGTLNNRVLEISWWNSAERNKKLSEIMQITSFSDMKQPTLKERIAYILNDLQSIPTCKTCGKHTKLHKNKFATYCSCKCAGKNRETQEKRKSTVNLKYGVDFVSQKFDTGIKRISPQVSSFLEDKDWLYNMHITQKKTSVEIAHIINNATNSNIHYSTVIQHIKNSGIEFKYNNSGSSLAETEIIEFLHSLGISNIKQSYRIENKEIDIYLPDYNIGIEYCGLYWHSINETKDTCTKNRHIDKLLFFKEKSIDLITIFENEWISKKDIIKSMLSSKLQRTPMNIYARMCNIVEIDTKTARNFLDENHIQGYTNASVNYALEYNGKIVMVMTFGKPRFNKKYDWELVRLCSRKYLSVVGGASKLLKHFITKHNVKSMISYSDKRFSTGLVYTKLGFAYSHTSQPNYFYWDKREYILQSRFKYQKHKLKNILNNYEDSLSESENMFNNGFRKIWDCGNDVWSLQI